MMRNLILKRVNKSFTKNAGFPVAFSKIDIDFEKNVFVAECENLQRNKKQRDKKKVSDYSDLSQMLLSKIKDRIKADCIDRAILTISFDDKKIDTDVFYQAGGEMLHMALPELL